MRIYRKLIPVAITEVLITLFASCQQELFNDVQERSSSLHQVTEQKPIVLSAYYDEDQGATKTSYESASGHILWSPGNQISLFYGSGTDGGSCFTATNDEPVQRTQFSGTIGVITGITEDSDDYYFWGVYPYSAQNSCDGSTVTAVVPHEQTAVAETFNDGEFVAIGKSAGLVMGFYNLCGAFYVKVTRNDITRITLKGKGDETLAGQVKISMSTGVPVVSDILDGENEVTLTRPNGAAFTPGVGYFISCLPNRFSTGFSFEMETSGGLIGIKEYNIDFTLGRNRFQPFNATIDSEVSFVSPSQPNNEIWYTTSSGSVYTISDWDGIVSNTYANGKGVIVFENDVLEIPYGKFSNYGMGGSKPFITSISLPASVQTIRTGAFGDQSIAELTIPYGCSCEEGAFGLMSGLQRIIGENATDDGRFLIENNTIILYAGAGISSLSENDFPINVTKIGKSAFSGQLSLTSVSMPYSITELGEGAFNLCNNLVNIVFSNQIRIIPSHCFYRFGNNITSIEFPSSLERIESYGITGLNLTNVIIPSNVTYIGPDVTFCVDEYKCMVVRVLATIPPTLVTEHAFGKYAVTDMGGYSLMDGTRIKVPSSSVSLYKADSKWSKYWIEEDNGNFW